MIITNKHQDAIQTQFLILATFLFMYINMVLILMGLVINDDLKGKRYILNVLETLLVARHNEEEEMAQDAEDSESPSND